MLIAWLPLSRFIKWLCGAFLDVRSAIVGPASKKIQLSSAGLDNLLISGQWQLGQWVTPVKGLDKHLHFSVWVRCRSSCFRDMRHLQEWSDDFKLALFHFGGKCNNFWNNQMVEQTNYQLSLTGDWRASRAVFHSKFLFYRINHTFFFKFMFLSTKRNIQLKLG